ncbi:H/ACA ribonucleoprotein complex subunit GAR1 [Halobium salinum]|uniref:H/ACA ribonucleoprotein complex subunit GAR1 n=1 Tax=Halobium salinum TaxID=1364940 RepID=A0ABD5PDC8_9EURY|nr:Gar1/Naf1 family protein [Halobium salinum]
MQRLGTVSRTAQGLAIVRAPEGSTPDIGTMAVDESLSTVGRVVDVFGPVDHPYLAITPNSGVHLPELLGQKLYAR